MRHLALVAMMMVPASDGHPALAQYGNGSQYALEKPPIPSIGDVFTYKIGYYRQQIYTYIGPQGDLFCYSVTRNGSVPDRVCKIKEDNFVQDSLDRPRLSFPLFVGKAWEYTYAGGNLYALQSSIYGHELSRKFTTHANVTAYERITTAMGTFDAFKIEATTIQWGESGVAFLATLYYSPKLGLLKREAKSAGHESSFYDYNVELVSYTPANASGAR
jgi:hypothetical protein